MHSNHLDMASDEKINVNIKKYYLYVCLRKQRNVSQIGAITSINKWGCYDWCHAWEECVGRNHGCEIN